MIEAEPRALADGRAIEEPVARYDSMVDRREWTRGRVRRPTGPNDRLPPGCAIPR